MTPLEAAPPMGPLYVFEIIGFLDLRSQVKAFVMTVPNSFVLSITSMSSLHYGSACAHFIRKTFFLQSWPYYTHFCRQMPHKSMVETRNCLNQQEIKF